MILMIPPILVKEGQARQLFFFFMDCMIGKRLNLKNALEIFCHEKYSRKKRKASSIKKIIFAEYKNELERIYGNEREESERFGFG